MRRVQLSQPSMKARILVSWLPLPALLFAVRSHAVQATACEHDARAGRLGCADRISGGGFTMAKPGRVGTTMDQKQSPVIRDAYARVCAVAGKLASVPSQPVAIQSVAVVRPRSPAPWIRELPA